MIIKFTGRWNKQSLKQANYSFSTMMAGIISWKNTATPSSSGENFPLSACLPVAPALWVFDAIAAFQLIAPILVFSTKSAKTRQ